MRGARWICASLALLACPASAAPQLKPSLKLLLEERFDTDPVFRNEAGQFGQLMTRLTPELGGSLKDRRFEGDAFYAADFRLRHGSGIFSWEHRAGMKLEAKPSPRIKIRADGRFWRVVDPTSLPRLGLARTFGPILYGKAGVSSDIAISKRVVLRPGYQFEGAHVLDGIALPGFVHTPSLGLWYGFTPLLRAGLEYRFQYFLLGPDGSLAQSAGAAVDWRITRHLVLTARGGPAWYTKPGDALASGVLPRASLELWQDLSAFNWGLTLGHDLVGASGFTAALWADYLSASAAWRVVRPVRIFAVVNLFRNGRAPNFGFDLRFAPSTGVSIGYAVEAGVEWEIVRHLALQATANRIAQTGGSGVAALNLDRNIALVRLMWTAL